ncbi:MAG: glycosyltransferase family 39 protein, partial [Promethearchaeota archaeon]
MDRSTKKLKSLFLFIIFHGILYLFFIPPWQSPDETRHFGYVTFKGTKLEPKAYENINREIIDSIDTYHAWKYQFIPPPYPLPQKWDGIPFYRGPDPVLRRAPLYYLLNSSIINVLKINGIINQFYMIRIFSFILFFLSIYFTFLSAQILFKGNLLYCLACVSFVAFLPQFLIISTSINPVSLAILLETILIYLMLLSLHKDKKMLIGLIGPIVIGLGFLNHRVALFMLPPFLVLLLIFFITSLKNKKDLLKAVSAIIIAFFAFLSIYLITHYFFPELLNKVAHLSGIKHRIAEINSFIHYLSDPLTKSMPLFLNGLFKSFWYFAGWLRFPYLLVIYSILKLICFLSFLGLIRYLFLILFKHNYKPAVDFQSFLILCAAMVPIVLATIIRYLPIIETAQGRYLFPAISAIAILFVLGLKEITPKKFENWVPIFVICGFVVLNIY